MLSYTVVNLSLTLEVNIEILAHISNDEIVLLFWVGTQASRIMTSDSDVTFLARIDCDFHMMSSTYLLFVDDICKTNLRDLNFACIFESECKAEALAVEHTLKSRLSE